MSHCCHQIVGSSDLPVRPSVAAGAGLRPELLPHTRMGSPIPWSGTRSRNLLHHILPHHIQHQVHCLIGITDVTCYLACVLYSLVLREGHDGHGWRWVRDEQTIGYPAVSVL